MQNQTLDLDAIAAAAAEHGDQTATKISKRTGISQAALSRLLARQTKPSVNTLVAFRAAYGISLDELIPREAEVTAA
jgi:transcriptional regulator with XRE-family HTH domain